MATGVFDYAYNANEMNKRLRDDDIFFQQLIDTIPPKFYFNVELQKTLIKEKHNAADKKIRTIVGLKRKLKSKGKHKFVRLDPQQQKTVSQIQESLENLEKSPSKKPKYESACISRAANLEELQKRLRNKIDTLSAKRKRTSVMSIEEKHSRRKMEKKNRPKKTKVISIQNTIPVSTTNKIQQKIPQKSIYNKEGKVVYSKFDFAESDKKERKKFNTSKKKKCKTLLNKVIKEKEKMKEIEEANPEKAMNIKEKNIWRKVIEKSEGIKVKDNPELLKKTIKKQNQAKHQSQKKWKERKELTEKLQNKRQQKRKENIRAKKQEKIDKKIKRAKKKGRIFPQT